MVVFMYRGFVINMHYSIVESCVPDPFPYSDSV